MIDEKKLSPDELKELKELRELGKKKRLWRIEVLFMDHRSNDIRRWEIVNRTAAQLKQFREDIFFIGIMVGIDPGHFEIFAPSSIREVHAYIQSKFYE